MFSGIFRCFFKPHIETHCATDAPLRFVFHTFCQLEPMVYIIICVDEGYVVLFCKAYVFLFTDVILITWMNVGIIKINRKVYIRSNQSFHDFARTGGTTGM